MQKYATMTLSDSRDSCEMEPTTEAGKAAQAVTHQLIYDYAIMVMELLKTRKSLTFSEIQMHFPYPDHELVQEAIHLAEQWGSIKFDYHSLAVIYNS
jgi:hypothetical protein